MKVEISGSERELASQPIDSGSFGKIYKINSQGGEKYEIPNELYRSDDSRSSAHMIGMDRIVVKALKPREELANIINDEEIYRGIVNRFNDEATRLLQLSHPHLVKVYEHHDGRSINQKGKPDAFVVGEIKPSYFVMPFYERNLRTALDERAITGYKEMCKMILQVGSALEYMYSKEFDDGKTIKAHDDIKPSNILLDLEGNAYLADLNMMLLNDAPDSAKNSLRTMVGQTMGVNALATDSIYRAPGSIDEKDKDQPNDVFSLGRVFSEMYRKSEDAPKVIKTELENIISKATNDFKSMRYSKIYEFMDDLELALLKNGYDEVDPVFKIRDALHSDRFKKYDTEDKLTKIKQFVEKDSYFNFKYEEEPIINWTDVISDDNIPPSIKQYFKMKFEDSVSKFVKNMYEKLKGKSDAIALKVVEFKKNLTIDKMLNPKTDIPYINEQIDKLRNEEKEYFKSGMKICHTILSSIILLEYTKGFIDIPDKTNESINLAYETIKKESTYQESSRDEFLAYFNLFKGLTNECKHDIRILTQIERHLVTVHDNLEEKINNKIPEPEPLSMPPIISLDSSENIFSEDGIKNLFESEDKLYDNDNGNLSGFDFRRIKEYGILGNIGNFFAKRKDFFLTATIATGIGLACAFSMNQCSEDNKDTTQNISTTTED